MDSQMKYFQDDSYLGSPEKRVQQPESETVKHFLTEIQKLQYWEKVELRKFMRELF